MERATLDLGNQRTALPARGYALRGELARIDADVAMALLTSASASGGKAVGGLTNESSGADFVNINLRAGEAVLYGHRFHDVTLRAQPSGQRWRLALRSKEATGAIALDTQAESGTVDAVRFGCSGCHSQARRCTGAGQSAGAIHGQRGVTGPDSMAEAGSGRRYVRQRGRDLGKLEVRAQPARDEWQIEQVGLSSTDGSIEAKGRWRPSTPSPSLPGAVGDTEVDVSLRWNDAGKFMSRFGLPKGVERGGTCRGPCIGPAARRSSTTPGSAASSRWRQSGGRFTEMEPGIAKLLGVLSLQSPPRRLSFNFDDILAKASL